MPRLSEIKPEGSAKRHGHCEQTMTCTVCGAKTCRECATKTGACDNHR